MLTGPLAARAEKIREQKLLEKLQMQHQQASQPQGNADLSLSEPFFNKDNRTRAEASAHNQQWSADDQVLIYKVTAYINGLTKTRNDKFYIDLLQEIELGPNSPRALTRELQNGLSTMLFLINQSTANTSSASINDIVAVATPTDAWSEHEQALIDWFIKNKETLPQGQFYLNKYMCVTSPKDFYRQLKEGIKEGPQGYRAKTGILQTRLKELYSYIHESK